MLPLFLKRGRLWLPSSFIAALVSTDVVGWSNDITRSCKNDLLHLGYLEQALHLFLQALRQLGRQTHCLAVRKDQLDSDNLSVVMSASSSSAHTAVQKRRQEILCCPNL